MRILICASALVAGGGKKQKSGEMPSFVNDAITALFKEFGAPNVVGVCATEAEGVELAGRRGFNRLDWRTTADVVADSQRQDLPGEKSIIVATTLTEARELGQKLMRRTECWELEESRSFARTVHQILERHGSTRARAA